MKLRTLLFSSTAISALCAAPVLAADVPVKAPAPAALFNWTGFYVGGNLGGVWGRSSAEDDPSAALCFFCGPGHANSPSGVIGGLQIGYNWQAGNLVYGVEADIALASASQSVDAFGGGGGSFHTSRLSGLATLRGRVGIAMSPTLLYVTGGAAYGWLKNEQVNIFTTATDRGNAWGWTLGAGIEHAFARNWSVKVEYLYTQFADAVVGDGAGYVFRFNDVYQVARVGINYRF